MSLKKVAGKTAKAALWPVKTPKRLVGWLFVGVAVFVFVLYGAIIMARGPALLAKAQKSIAGAYVSISGDAEPVPDLKRPEPEMSIPVDQQFPEPPLPCPKPQWANPTRQSAMLDPRDGCALLAGLNHQIGKCWSYETYDRCGVSKSLYHADWAMICDTKRKAGLSCRR